MFPENSNQDQLKIQVWTRGKQFNKAKRETLTVSLEETVKHFFSKPIIFAAKYIIFFQPKLAITLVRP